MSRLHLIEKTLNISTNQFAFTCEPARDDNLLNNVIEQTILPGSMQEQSRLQFSLVPILRKGR